MDRLIFFCSIHGKITNFTWYLYPFFLFFVQFGTVLWYFNIVRTGLSVLVLHSTRPIDTKHIIAVRPYRFAYFSALYHSNLFKFTCLIIIFKSFSNHFQIILISFLYHFQVILKSFSNHFCKLLMRNQKIFVCWSLYHLIILSILNIWMLLAGHSTKCVYPRRNIYMWLQSFNTEVPPYRHPFDIKLGSQATREPHYRIE